MGEIFATLEEISVWISVFALIMSIVAVLYVRGKYKLSKKDVEINEKSLKQQKYDSYVNEISPEPHINIFNGELQYRRKHSKLGDEKEEIVGATIRATIGNCDGTAIEPKWIYRVNFKNRKPHIGRWSVKGISMQVGITHNRISFIPAESQRYYLETDVLEIEDLFDMESLDSIEIWIEYEGKKDILYNSYKIFKFKNKEWTDENKRTKVWRVKP